MTTLLDISGPKNTSLYKNKPNKWCYGFIFYLHKYIEILCWKIKPKKWKNTRSINKLNIPFHSPLTIILCMCVYVRLKYQHVSVMPVGVNLPLSLSWLGTRMIRSLESRREGHPGWSSRPLPACGFHGNVWSVVSLSALVLARSLSLSSSCWTLKMSDLYKTLNFPDASPRKPNPPPGPSLSLFPLSGFIWYTRGDVLLEVAVSK